MANPTVCHGRQLKRRGRYLRGRPRAVTTFLFQNRPCLVEGLSDSDWAGCRRTARSTSGGAIFIWHHLLKSLSTTQRNISIKDFVFCALELRSWRPIGVSISSPTFSWTRPQQLEWCTAVGMASCVMSEWGLSGFRKWWKTVRSVSRRYMGPTTCQTS